MSTARNFNRAARKVNRYARELRGEVGPALRRIGEEIMTDVKASRPGAGVPRDTGALAASGRVEGSGPVTLSFGDAAAPYAMRQHEVMGYRHNVGEARYLVRGVDRWVPGGSAAMYALRQNAEAAAARIGRT